MTAGRLERIGSYGVLAAFALLAIYPILSILFLALHRKTDLVTGFAFPIRPDLSSFRAAWTEGNFATGFKSTSWWISLLGSAIEQHISAGRLKASADQIKKCRFSGAIGADDADPLTGGNGQVNAPNNFGLAKTLAQVLQFECITCSLIGLGAHSNSLRLISFSMLS